MIFATHEKTVSRIEQRHFRKTLGRAAKEWLTGRRDGPGHLIAVGRREEGGGSTRSVIAGPGFRFQQNHGGISGEFRPTLYLMQSNVDDVISWAKTAKDGKVEKMALDVRSAFGEA